MAKVIKGITVEIGGNASPLKKALNDVDKTSRNLQSELRTIDKLLKLDPTNVELLTQKQNVLSESIETTEEKLRRLKSAEEKVAQAFEDGKIDAEQYRAFQRNIVTTEQKLNDLKSELNKTGQAFTDLGTDAQKSEKKLDDYKKEVDDVKSAVSDLKDKAKDTALELGAGVAAAGGAASAAIMSFDSVEGALNHLQAQTGLSSAEMDKFKTALETVYNDNFGEDMQDIANVMASVAQYTGETDADKIKNITENVFTLRDTFEYDYTESLRTVKMLMEHFGVSADEAFNLIVQGTQKGLNKNGDLLDSVNEYAVHYKQLGYTAEEFFNSLENGTAAGTFSVDKLGDAMKEFGIRTKDTASTTVEAFTLLGYSAKASSEDIEKAKGEVAKLEKNLSYAKAEQNNFNESTSELTKQKNADKIAEYTEKLETAKNKLAELTDKTDGSKKSMEELQAKFAAGGETAKEATKEILDQLFAIDDKVLQNQIGVDLFGTMWEDLGIEGVKALMNVTGEADKATDSMQKIKDIEYDDLGNRLEGLGRKVQTEIINPAVEDFYPEAEDFIDWVADNLDTLIPILEGVAKQVAIVWSVKKGTEIAKSVANLIDNYKTLATATKTATDGQKGLNAAQKANVIGLVVGAVLSLISAIDTYNETQWENSSLKKEIDKTKELTDDWNELADSMSSKIEEINDTELDMKVNFEDVNKLKERLQEIIKDGTIDESEKGEYTTIIDLLSGKVDGFKDKWSKINLKTVNGEIKITDNISDVNKSLDDLIKKWELTQTKMTMSEMYNSLKTESAKKEVETEALKDEATNSDKSIDNFIKYVYEGSKLSMSESEVVANEIIKANGDLEKASDSIKSQLEKGSLDPKKFKNLYDNSQYVYFNGGYIKSLFNDWKAEDRIKEYTDSINDYNKSIKNGESQLGKMKNKTDDLYRSLKILSGGQGTYNDYIKLSTKYGMTHEAVLDLLKDKGIKTWNDLEKAAKEQNASINDELENLCKNFITAETGTKESLEQQVSDMTENYKKLKDAVDAGAPGVTQSMVDNAKSMVDSAITELDKFKEQTPQPAKDGVDAFTGELTSDETNEKLKGAGKNLRDKTNEGIDGEDGAYQIGFGKGKDYGNGFCGGISDSFFDAYSAGDSLAAFAMKGTQDKQKSSSPSKEARKLGNDNGDGYVLGVIDKKDDAADAGEALAENALSAMRARQKIINSFSQTNNDQNNMILPSVSNRIMAQTSAKSNNTPEVKQINLGGLTLKIEHFENRSAADVNKVTDQFMHAVENYVNRRDAFK